MHFKMFVSFVALLLATTTTTIDSGKAKNGYWWTTFDEPEKLAFVQGYIEGLSRANVLLRGSVNFDDSKIVHKVSKEPVTSYLDFSEISYGQYIQGLDVFYSDYRNKRINFNAAILYIRDQVRGIAQTELDKRLEGMRKGAVEPGYDER
jgi:hypothetical protein